MKDGAREESPRSPQPIGFPHTATAAARAGIPAQGNPTATSHPAPPRPSPASSTRPHPVVSDGFRHSAPARQEGPAARLAKARPSGQESLGVLLSAAGRGGARTQLILQAAPRIPRRDCLSMRDCRCSTAGRGCGNAPTSSSSSDPPRTNIPKNVNAAAFQRPGLVSPRSLLIPCGGCRGLGLRI